MASPVVHVTPDGTLGVQPGRFHRELLGAATTAADAAGGHDGTGGSVVLPAPAGSGSWVQAYVRVDDLTTCVARAGELGGYLVAGPMPAGEPGWTFALVADPDGRMIGLLSGR